MNDVEALADTVAALERKVEGLEERIVAIERELDQQGVAAGTDTGFRSSVDLTCPTCGGASEVTTAREAAAILEERGELTGELVEVLSTETHACVGCREAFTP